MSADIGPGDWIECVFAGEHPEAPNARLIVGAIYVAEWVGQGAYKRELAPGVRVVGDPLPAHCAWRLSDFRPVRRPGGNILRDLLQPIDAELEAA